MRLFLLSFICVGSLLQSQEALSDKDPDLLKVSEAFGHLIGKNLETFNVELDSEAIVRGLKDALAGKTSPMSESDCILALGQIQETSFQKVAQENLKSAELFLEQNKKKENVVVMEEGKLQYICEKTGTGPQVTAHSSPLIHYKGFFIDGKVFGSSQEDEVICLDETIAGFTKGLLGMREGEKRTLFIHPDLGYGTSGFLPPNSLLTFEIEVIKSSISSEDREALSLKTPGLLPMETPFFEPKSDNAILR